jgi:hypothetical protein
MTRSYKRARRKLATPLVADVVAAVAVAQQPGRYTEAQARALIFDMGNVPTSLTQPRRRGEAVDDDDEDIEELQPDFGVGKMVVAG